MHISHGPLAAPAAPCLRKLGHRVMPPKGQKHHENMKIRIMLIKQFLVYWFAICSLNVSKLKISVSFPDEKKGPGPPTDGRDHPSHARENVQSAGVAPQHVLPSSKNVAKSFACEVPESFGST